MKESVVVPLPRVKRGGTLKKADCQLGAACFCRKSGWRGSGCIAEEKEQKVAA